MNALLTSVLVFIRCGALFFLFPVVSAPQFPVRARLGLAAVLTFFLSPSIPEHATSLLGVWEWIILIFQEVMVGLLLGFVGRMTFHALEFTATLVGTETGLNIASTFNPMADSRTEVFGTMTYLMGAMLLFTLDIHHWLIIGFQRSYTLVPIGQARLSSPLLMDVLARTSEVLQAGVIMAAPVLAISFVVSLTFALLNRAVPSINVFSESFSFRILAGLMVFGLTLHLTAQHASNYLRRIPDDLLRVSKLLTFS